MIPDFLTDSLKQYLVRQGLAKGDPIDVDRLSRDLWALRPHDGVKTALELLTSVPDLEAALAESLPVYRAPEGHGVPLPSTIDELSDYTPSNVGDRAEDFPRMTWSAYSQIVHAVQGAAHVRGVELSPAAVRDLATDLLLAGLQGTQGGRRLPARPGAWLRLAMGSESIHGRRLKTLMEKYARNSRYRWSGGIIEDVEDTHSTASFFLNGTTF